MLSNVKNKIKLLLSILAINAIVLDTEVFAQEKQNALSLNVFRLYNLELSYEHKLNDRYSMLFNSTLPFSLKPKTDYKHPFRDVSMGSRMYVSPVSYGTFFSVHVGMTNSSSTFFEINSDNRLYGEVYWGYHSDGETLFYEYALGIRGITSYEGDYTMLPRLKLNIGLKL